MQISTAYTFPTNTFPHAGNTEENVTCQPFVSAILSYQEKFNLPKEIVTPVHSPEDPERPEGDPRCHMGTHLPSKWPLNMSRGKPPVLSLWLVK